MTSVRRAPWIDEPDLPTRLHDAGEVDTDMTPSLEDSLVTGMHFADERAERLALSGCRLSSVTWTGASIRNVTLIDVVVEDCELSGATVDFATFQRVRFERCRMSGFIAPQLQATHVTFSECRMDQCWLRMASVERCAFEDCDLTAADFYTARINESRFVRSTLDEAELSDAVLRDVAFHGSTVDGIKGAEALRDITIGSDQVVSFAFPVFGSLGIAVDDDYFGGPDDLPESSP